jgi:glycosyltransferase involved in cell wall biosynthesis
MRDIISPLKGRLTTEKPWEGFCQKKPWEYDVTAVIPVLDTFDTLELVVKLLRLQTIRPFIVIIDTGSTDEEYQKIEALRDEDIEVHALRIHGVLHPSDYPAMAMDLAFSLCRTDYLFATHSDCFLRRRDFLEWMLQKCRDESPVVGYRLSPREHIDWEFMVSHTATMYHMPTMDKIGFGWSLRRLGNVVGIKDITPNPNTPNWPDTEVLGNYILKRSGIEPLFVGNEDNFARNVDENIDHPRTYTSAKLYSPPHLEKMQEWIEGAMEDARKRIEAWSK